MNISDSLSQNYDKSIFLLLGDGLAIKLERMENPQVFFI